jgi:sporulation protein YlmC with PRC-barrel domain
MFEGKDMQELPNALIGKTVLNAKGTIVGIIGKTITDASSGEVVSVLIKPSKEANLHNFSLTDLGEIIFPFASLSSVKDVVIIDEPLK